MHLLHFPPALQDSWSGMTIARIKNVAFQRIDTLALNFQVQMANGLPKITMVYCQYPTQIMSLKFAHCLITSIAHQLQDGEKHSGDEGHP